MPAIQSHKVRLCCIKGDEIALFCGGYIRYQAGNILLNGRWLHGHWLGSGSVCRMLLGSMPSSQPYKVHLTRIFIHHGTRSRLGQGLRIPKGGLELERVFCQKAAYVYRCCFVD